MNHYSRRRVLKMVGLVAVTSAAGHLLPLARLNAAQPDAQTDELDIFMQISQQLTQQDELNETVGAALYDTLSQIQKNFSSALLRLSSLLAISPICCNRNACRLLRVTQVARSWRALS